MSEQPDRPESLGRRQRPRPAADEYVDPIDTAARVASPSGPSAAPTRESATPKGRQREATAQLGTRIDVQIANGLSTQAAEEGVTQRVILERSLQFYFAHSEVASRLAAEAEHRNVDTATLLDEALRSYLR